MNQQEYNHLIDKVNNGSATPEEMALYGKYIDFISSGGQEWDVNALGTEDELKAELLRRIEAAMPAETAKQRRLWPRIAAAASVLIALSVGAYLVVHQKQPVQTAQNQPHDIAPGHNQATLTLANGKKIILTKNLKGQLAVQGNTTINVNSNTSIAYTAAAFAEAAPQYNTLSTAKG